MKKPNLFIKKLHIISDYINSLLEKNLNRLKLVNLIKLIKNNKIILTFVALFVLLISYLLMPTFYNQEDVSSEIKLKLAQDLNLNFKFSNNIQYNIFPKPHFKTNQAIILNENNEISKIDNLRIYVSYENLHSLKKIIIKDVTIKNANFFLNKKNYNFFIKLLSNNFQNKNLTIKKSNVFFKNSDKEVLFINKIINLRYYYDTKELKNFVVSKNKIFNFEYDIELHKDSIQKKIFSKLKINFIKLKIDNELDYSEENKNGVANFTLNKTRSTSKYELNNKLFKFNFFDKLENPKYSFNGEFNFNPFYSSLTGTTKQLDTNYLLNSNAIFIQILKTKLFNHENIDFFLNINADNLYNNLNFKSIFFKLKIKESLIDINNTNFKWKNFAKFKISDSLIYVKDKQLVLDGKLHIKIFKQKEIFKYLLTPKKYRKELKDIDLNFSYNFDQKSISFNDIIIDNKYNKKINQKINEIIFKENNLQNRIYIKNFVNNALKSYSG